MHYVMKPFRTAAAGDGRTRVHAELYRIGSDILAVLGGAGPHIGAASLSGTEPGDRVNVSTLAAWGHKEPELTERLSRAIASSTGRRTLTVAGIHLDGITSEEIETIRRNVGELIRLLEDDPSGISEPT